VAEPSNEAVVEVYDRVAGFYDRAIAPLEAGTTRRALELLSPGPGERLLEVGCGPGRALPAFARRIGPTGRVTGLDAAPGMAARARRRAERRGAGARIDLLLGDARALPVAGGAFDVAFVEDTLELFPPAERRRVLAEIRRALTAEGRLGVVTMEREGAERSLFVRLYDRAFARLPACRRFGCRPIRAARSLREGGFEIVRRERHARGFVWPVEILVARPAAARRR